MNVRTAGSTMVLTVLLTAGGLLAATACSNSSGSGTKPSSSASSSGQPRGTKVTVTETEYSLHLSRSRFAPGTYTFVADDTGKVGHALAITGPGVPATRTDVLSPGGTAQLTVTLQAGSYELWCPVDGHKGLGMDTHIQVGAAATGTTPSPSTSTSTSGSGY